MLIPVALIQQNDSFSSITVVFALDDGNVIVIFDDVVKM